jgi:hypothetical protein
VSYRHVLFSAIAIMLTMLPRHGRDSKLRVWQLKASDESTFSVVLPIQDPVTPRHEPWLLHTISVNTLNFCSFSACEASPSEAAQLSFDAIGTTLLVAVPGDTEGDIDVYSLPSKAKLTTVCAPKTPKLGKFPSFSSAFIVTNIAIKAWPCASKF